MVKEFFGLNKKKLLKLPLIVWLVLFILIVIASQIFKGGGEKVSLSSGIWIAFIYATALVVTFVIVSLFAGVYTFRKKRKIFNRENLAGFFQKNRFETVLINTETKLLFTEEAKIGIVKEFLVIADLVKDHPGSVQFKFYVQSEPIDKQEYSILEKKFRQYNGGFEIGYIFRNIDKKLSALEIEYSLNEFASLLNVEKFKPGVRD